MTSVTLNKLRIDEALKLSDICNNKAPIIADEDTAMDIIESIDFVNKENIDHESSQFSFSFSAETAHLVQENDSISDTDDSDSESSSISDGDGDDEMSNDEDDMYQLRSIAPDTIAVAAATETVSVQSQKNKALVLKATGGSHRKISALMNIPRGRTIYEHRKRAQTRKGKANPIKHKRVMPSKITENAVSTRYRYIYRIQMSNDNQAYYQHNCVFVDEASVMANMRRNYAWSAAGEVAHVKVPQMYTLEVCLKINKVGQGGRTKSRDFYAFLNLVMDKLDGRNLKYKGWNIMCDNAPIHTAHYIANRVSERENFFSEVKLLFRHIDDNTNFIEQTSENQTEDLEQRLTLSLAKVILSD
ncbi:hypothetical protein INT45_006566 [Circinella minor]|uniref:Tc1-like transposase DDE domain-containing protein n=1 Tax=Circinella minor TaxID=1195481 RepID=A0A8H7S1B1_9FUNG|nr:hypothetical protein INT45_006566 [Circinella minor]